MCHRGSLNGRGPRNLRKRSSISSGPLHGWRPDGPCRRTQPAAVMCSETCFPGEGGSLLLQAWLFRTPGLWTQNAFSGAPSSVWEPTGLFSLSVPVRSRRGMDVAFMAKMSPECGNPLEEWTLRKTGSPCGPDSLAPFHLQRLRAAIERAGRTSPFYRKLLASFPPFFPRTLEEYGRLPFTCPGDIAEDPMEFLAVPQDTVARIVTARTSGTSGNPKRVFFSGGDLSDTTDMFSEGMRNLAGDGSKVMIILPGKRPGSVGDLLVQSLRAGSVPLLCPFSGEGPVLKKIDEERPDCLVGPPSWVISLARHPLGKAGKCLSSVLLCSDFIPESLELGIKSSWGCSVYRHYGMTETGYGGALSCSLGPGMHLMEGSFYFEIVHPETGDPVPEGGEGEIIVTPLLLEGTPLLRYRTGDRGMIIPGKCPCGSSLRRMKVRGRYSNGLDLPGGILPLADLDETLFSLPWLGGYEVRREHDSFALTVKGYPLPGERADVYTLRNETERKLAFLPQLNGSLPEITILLHPDGEQLILPAKRIVYSS